MPTTMKSDPIKAITSKPQLMKLMRRFGTDLRTDSSTYAQLPQGTVITFSPQLVKNLEHEFKIFSDKLGRILGIK